MSALTRQGVDDLREWLGEEIVGAQRRVERGSDNPLDDQLNAYVRARAAERLAALILALDRSHRLLSQKDVDQQPPLSMLKESTCPE